MRRPPRSAMFEDGVQDGEQLAHAGHQRHLLRLAGAHQPLVELLDGRVKAGGHQGPHVQCLPNPLPPAPHPPTSSKSTGVPVQRGHAHQGRELLGGELSAAELRQLGHKRPGQDGSHPRHAAQERLVLAPGGALSDRSIEVAVGAGEFLFEPLYVRLDALPDGGLSGNWWVFTSRAGATRSFGGLWAAVLVAGPVPIVVLLIPGFRETSGLAAAGVSSSNDTNPACLPADQPLDQAVEGVWGGSNRRLPYDSYRHMVGAV